MSKVNPIYLFIRNTKYMYIWIHSFKQIVQYGNIEQAICIYIIHAQKSSS